jgi:hypothetical protein
VFVDHVSLASYRLFCSAPQWRVQAGHANRADNAVMGEMPCCGPRKTFADAAYGMGWYDRGNLDGTLSPRWAFL